MNLHCYGAAREVTGSCHYIDTGEARILLDCGMHQGGEDRHGRNRAALPFPVNQLDCVLLSHAHIDHCGRLPLLTRAGYDGPIVTSSATVALCQILLPDAAHIQEEDAAWKIKRLKKKGEDYSWVQPLFTREEVEATLEQFESVPFRQVFPIGDHSQATFAEAGHILGAAIIELGLRTTNHTVRFTFSGDLGIEGARLLRPPTLVDCPDYLLIESTYGDRVREDEGDLTELLFQVIEDTADRGGKVVIPSFAVGRTQEILARINDLVESGRMSGIPVYVDSPMALAATRAFAMHPECYSEAARRLLRAGDKPLEFDGLRFTHTVEESMAINEITEPCVIISASGMCDAGRIKHHLRHNIGNPKSTVLFVGYQASNSLGHAIQTGRSPVRIFGEMHEVKARVETIHGFSAHADKDGLLNWFRSLGDVPRQTFVVHGEEESSLHFAAALQSEFGAATVVPQPGEGYTLE